MVKIVDASLGGYSILEDFQGLKIEGSNGQTIAKVNTLNEALQYIATRLVIESDKILSLSEYAALRKDIFEKIVAAQEVEQYETTNQ
jgi:hypothetical protein